MRDGIYKGLKLGRRWGTFLRRCEREADRGSRARTAALAALEGDLRRDVSPATVRKFLSAATSAASLLPGLSPRDPISRPGLCNAVAAHTPLEDILSRHFRRVISTGVSGHDAVYTTIRDALHEWRARRLRHIAEYYVSNAGNAARDVLHAVEHAMDAIDCAALAAGLIRNEQVSRPEQHSIDLDENLLGRHAK